VRYQLPAAPGRAGEAVYLPPLLPAAAFTGPVRWQVKLPAGAVPLLTGGGTAEFRWRLGTTGLAPSPLASADGMERWFQTGEDPGGEANAEDVTARQAAPGPVRLYRVPRTGLVILCSVVVFVLLLVLSRLPGWAVGPVVAVVGGAVGVTAVMLPHPAAHVAGAAQPGLAGAAVVLLSLALARLSYRRRVSRLPGFARSIPTEPAADAPVIPSSARKRASVVGSSGAAPVTPAGG
jgi:hypothetical protein